MNESEFVMGWVTNEIPPKPNFSGLEKWLMVEHKSRGWELPGGKINNNESVERAIIREIFEETGIIGYIRKGPIKFQKGLIFWIGIDNDLEFNNKQDPNIITAKWFSSPPNNLAWGISELKTISQLFYDIYNNSECSKI